MFQCTSGSQLLLNRLQHTTSNSATFPRFQQHNGTVYAMHFSSHNMACDARPLHICKALRCSVFSRLRNMQPAPTSNSGPNAYCYQQCSPLPPLISTQNNNTIHTARGHTHHAAASSRENAHVGAWAAICLHTRLLLTHTVHCQLTTNPSCCHPSLQYIPSGREQNWHGLSE